MRLVKSTGNIQADLKKVIYEWRAIIAASVHVGKAGTVTVKALTLLDFTNIIFQQCAKKLDKVRIGKI